LKDHGKFARTNDPDMIAGASFLGGYFGLFDGDGLKRLPCSGGYLEQPAELMDVLKKLERAILAQRK